MAIWPLYDPFLFQKRLFQNKNSPLRLFLVSSYFASHPITVLIEILGGRNAWAVHSTSNIGGPFLSPSLSLRPWARVSPTPGWSNLKPGQRCDVTASSFSYTRNLCRPTGCYSLVYRRLCFEPTTFWIYCYIVSLIGNWISNPQGKFFQTDILTPQPSNPVNSNPAVPVRGRGRVGGRR